MTTVSLTTKEYFLQKGDEMTQSILTGFPYNLRYKPKHPTDFFFGNDVGSCPFPLPLFTDFEKGLKYFHREMNFIKSTGSPFGIINCAKLVLCLPYSVAAFIIHNMASKMTWVITNVPGP